MRRTPEPVEIFEFRAASASRRSLPRLGRPRKGHKIIFAEVLNSHAEIPRMLS